MIREAKELFWGTPHETAALQEGQILKKRPNLNHRQQERLIQAERLTRRLFIRRAVSVTAGLALIAGGVELSLAQRGNQPNLSEAPKDHSEGWYQQLPGYYDKVLPTNLERLIAEDLLSQTRYSSLVESGRIIIESLDYPKSIEKYDPIVVNSTRSFLVRFGDLGNNIALFSDEGTDRTTGRLTLNKKGGGVVSFSGVKPESWAPVVTLNKDLLTVHASPWVMRLMIAKEASHFLYFAQARSFLLEELRQNYELGNDPETETVLFNTALSASDSRLKLPFISNRFGDTAKFIDYAGYGHIALDLALMSDKGLLTEIDRKILSYNLGGVTEGKARGLIIKDPNNPQRYKWKDGVTPFSQSWFDVMDEVHNNPSLHD